MIMIILLMLIIGFYITGYAKADGEITTWNGNITLNENYHVDEQETLIIEPGTTIIFKNNASLIVKGVLMANGTAESSIYFTGMIYNSSLSDPDSQIKFININDNQSYINHAYFSSILIEIKNSLRLSNSVITNNSKVFIFGNCSPEISNNIFKYNGILEPFEPWFDSPYYYPEEPFVWCSAVWTETLKCSFGSTAKISNNTFFHNGGFGLDINEASPIVENNTFNENRMGGIYIYNTQSSQFSYANPTITGNFIINHGAPEEFHILNRGKYDSPGAGFCGGGVVIYDDVDAIFYNNQIFNNDVGIIVEGRKEMGTIFFNNDTITDNAIGVCSYGGSSVFNNCYLNNSIYDFRLIAYSNVKTYNTTFNESKLYIIRESKLETEDKIFSSMLGGLSITAIGASILILGTELGKYKFFAFSFPLYNKLKRENILDQFIRGQIYGLIRGQPGIHYSEIRRTLKIGNGTLAYHLSVLEKEGFVKSKRSNIRKLFYPTELPAKFKDLNKKFPRGEEIEEGIKLSNLQEKITSIIKENPGITQKEIVLKVKIPKQTVSYNITRLAQDRIINIEKYGNKTRCYLIS